MRRIVNTASEFLGTQPDGQLTNMRFEVALVDAVGVIKIVENVMLQ